MTQEVAKSVTNMCRAIAYIRVSTAEQGEKGLSTDYQIELAKKYVDEFNTNIDKGFYSSGNEKPKKLSLEIIEEEKSASKVHTENVDKNLWESLRSRPKLQHILELAENKQFEHLILLSRDRLTRNFEQFIALKYILDRKGVKIHYTRNGEDLNIEDKKINRFLDNILASVAELEADVISVRVKGGGRVTVKNGNWAGGRPPYGYMIENIKITNRKPIAKLKPSVYEQNNVIEVFNLYNLGYGYRTIAEKMNSQCKNNAWTKSKVESIIKNETYTGYITWDRRGGRRHPGKHKEQVQSDFIESLSFISKSRWEELSRFRKYKTELKDPKYYDTPYLLKNKLFCGKCGEKLKPKNYGKNKENKNTCVYRCLNCKSSEDNRYELVIPKESIENKVLKSVENTLKIEVIDIAPYWNLYIDERETEEQRIKDVIAEIDKKISDVKLLKKNIALVFQDIGKRDIKNYIKDPEKKDIKKDVANMVKEKLYNNLIHQQILLSKIEAQYKSEKAARQEEYSNKFNYDEVLLKRGINQFISDFGDLDLRRKRLLIDLLIDKIIVNKSSDGYSTKIIMIPNQLIK